MIVFDSAGEDRPVFKSIPDNIHLTRHLVYSMIILSLKRHRFANNVRSE